MPATDPQVDGAMTGVNVRYLPCQVRPGMFTDELLVYLDGLDPVHPEQAIKAQMLVDRREVEGLVGTPSRDRPAAGWVRVTLAKESGGVAEVVLPQPAQPFGEILLVDSRQLKRAAGA